MGSKKTAGPGQHTVPRFHLQPFAVGPKKRQAVLWQYDKVSDTIEQVCVRKAGVVPDFYTLEGTEAAHEIDFALQGIENRAAPVIARLASAALGPLHISDDDRFTVALYMAFLNRRVPAAVTAFRHQVEAMYQLSTIDGLKDRSDFHTHWRSRGGQGDEAAVERTRLEWLDLLENRGYRLVADPKIGLSGLGGVPREALRIACGMWFLLRRTSHPAFLIGDAPAKLLSARPSATPIFEPNGPGFRWQVPLSPSCALVVRLDDTDAPEQVIDAVAEDPTLDEEWASVLPPKLKRDAGSFHGVMAWRMAERWVWAKDKTDLERIGSGFHEEKDRRMPASELHRRTGMIRPRDPKHTRELLDETRRRVSAQ